MRWLKAYTTVMKVSVHSILQYRVNVFMTWFISILSLVVPFTFWSTVYNSNSKVIGYNHTEMITYIILSTILSRFLLYDGIQQSISQDIRDGKLSQYLVKPISYKMYTFSNTIIKKVMDFLVIILLLPFFIVPLVNNNYLQFSLHGNNILFFIIATALAIGISFNIYYILGLISFWMVECSGLYIALGTAFNFLAGGLFPLDIFRELKLLSKYLPFQYQLFFPIKVYLGNLSEHETFEGLVIQMIWFVLITILAKLLWRKGIRRFSSVGG